MERLGAQIGGARYAVAEFIKLRGPASYLVLMPQWDFLDFLAAEGARYPGFHWSARLRCMTSWRRPEWSAASRRRPRPGRWRSAPTW